MNACARVLFVALAFALPLGGCTDDDDDGDSTVLVNQPAPDPQPDPGPIPDPDPDPDPEPPPPPPPSGWVAPDSGTGIDIQAVTAIDANNAWVAADSDILRTQDGGKTWTLVGQSPMSALGLGRLYIKDMQFLDSSNGWAVTFENVLSTTDGGKTWTSHLGTATALYSAISFISPSTGWVVSNKAGIRKTTDGGATWTDITVNGQRPWMLAVKFIDANTGWVSGNSSIWKTTDGGQTWDQQVFSSDTDFAPLVAISSERAWAVAHFGELIVTEDGQSWSVQEVGASVENIHFRDANSGWAVGQQIHHTTNGGAAWSVQSTSEQGFKDIVFVNSTTGWAVGTGGVILKTTTGGQK